MNVSGFWPTFALGLLGGAISETLRIVEILRKDEWPSLRELLASLLIVLLGGCAVLYGWSEPQGAIKIATLGAAFPLLFSAGVRAATAKPDPSHKKLERRRRSLVDYVAGRF